MKVNNELHQAKQAIRQVWELTAYIDKVANSLYDEDMTTLNEWAISLLGVKELISREALFALDKIEAAEGKESNNE